MDREACLRRSTSPFVLDGLRSKVQWWAWCEEAFQKAKAEDKPILVDVGAVWCHWCHVIDETTYNDDEIADIINKHFVPIKVDRDERPDVDRRLQEYAVLVSGQSGWPLTVFMTPEGEVIWAATYLPPRDYGGLPGMAKVLRAVLEAYRTKKGDIKKMAEDLSKEIAAWHNPSEAELDRSVQLDILASLAASFDEEYGGFGTAPKFPPITQLDLLLLRHFYDGKSVYGKMAHATLRAMARGGVYDQLGGGFFRYSTDRLWLIPHYEKLLVDNAELLSLYARAYAHFGDQLYRKTAAGIIKWLDEFMRDPGGGYYASQDADVDGEEGAYYRWTEDELKEALGDLFPKAAEMFGLYEFKWPEG
ncbi:thioredoxin domain-containing protein, partial [Pyrobaculum sp.]|uniref:thioredoxin domain-containing protein n=1 Tax=Pyrobaculum sp. TaxID=2004705 RepID=UPI00317E62B3